MYFPVYRPRRLRKNETLRRMVRETKVSADDFIYPLFVTHGRGVRKEIRSMPGIAQLSIDLAVKEAKEVFQLGVPAVILFGIPKKKDLRGSEAYARSGIIQQAIRAIKDKIPELAVITDVCLCEYTSHGHCGMVVKGQVDNDATLKLLAKMSLSHAEAGADVIARKKVIDPVHPCPRGNHGRVSARRCRICPAHCQSIR